MTLSLKRLQPRAARLGLRLERSRAKALHHHNRGGYMIIDVSGNYVVAGSRYELEIQDVRDHLDQGENRE